MKFVSNYDEFGARNGISAKDHISSVEIPDKELILNYLKKGECDGVVCAGIYDYATDTPTGKTNQTYTDGCYYWTDAEIYHFDNYNLELDPEFIEYVKGAQ